MPCEVLRIEDNVIFARVSGVLRLSEQQALQKMAALLIAEGKKVRMLAIFEDFQGWEKGVDWSDIDFLLDHGTEITRMAMVGDPAWQEKVFAFLGKNFRSTEMEFFPPDNFKDAMLWVRA